MARRSIMEIADELDARGDGLAALPGGPEPTAVHYAALDVMTDLMTLGREILSASNDSNPVFSAMMTMVERSRPMMVEGIANVPPAAIRQFLADLGTRIQTVVDTPLTDQEIAAALEEAEPVDGSPAPELVDQADDDAARDDRGSEPQSA